MNMTVYINTSEHLNPGEGALPWQNDRYARRILGYKILILVFLGSSGKSVQK